MNQIEKPDNQQGIEQTKGSQTDDQPLKPKKRSLLLPFFLFLVVLLLIAGGSYFGWQQFMLFQQRSQSAIDELLAELAQRPTRAQLDNLIRPLQQSIGQSDGRLSKLEQDQAGLLESTENLYELYGRDENGWKLAEIEYLLSVAQHKLVLENDFEGSAKTLNAASERIAELADPGLLPVRVKINEEIASLKTRIRPDLVGMTLLLSRLSRQITHLTPGYQTQSVKQSAVQLEATDEANVDQPLEKKVMDFVTSLVTIKTSKPRTEKVEQTVIMNITEKLEQNLKLTRWSVLERDATQYLRLMSENLKLFREYYDLEKAANKDFYESLLKLDKTQIKPELPNISGSLQLLIEIQQQRENSPQQAVDEATDNG